MSRVGIDVDGVLADFNYAFINLIVDFTGRDLFPPRPFDIPCWDYPEQYGYAREEIRLVEKCIQASICFWQDLPPYLETREATQVLEQRLRQGDDLYFITSRPGITAKAQTERWLSTLLWNVARPVTVLISSDKGLCACALELDYYIDDKIENVNDVAFDYPKCRTFLLNRSWNGEDQGVIHHRVTRVTTLPQMFAEGI